MDELNLAVKGNAGMYVEPCAHLSVAESSVECFRVLPVYQTQDSATQINVLNKLKEWIAGEEKRLNIGVAKNDTQHAK